MRIRLRSTEKGGKKPNLDTFSSPATERRCTQKVKKMLPETPRRKARVVENLVKSPSCKKTLEEKGVTSTKKAKESSQIGEAVIRSLNESLEEIKPKGTIRKAQLQAYKALKHVALCVSHKTRTKHKLLKHLKMRKEKVQRKNLPWWATSREKRKDCIPEIVKEQVKYFYLSAAISREVPDKKAALKVREGTGFSTVQRHNMVMTLEDAFDIFKRTYPETKIGFTAFRKLRPIQVIRVLETNRRTCLCQPCCNAALKTDGLKKLFQSHQHLQDISTKVLPKRSAIEATLYPFDSEFPRSACIDRKCKDCGTHLLIEHYKELVSATNKDLQIKWSKWEYITIQREDTTKRIISCVEKACTVQAFFEDYVKDLDSLASHVFRADWQHKQMQLCINNLEIDEAVISMDYAENYKCQF